MRSVIGEGHRVTAFPGREGPAVSSGDNMLIADRSGTAVVLAFRRAVQGEAFDLALVDERAALRRTVDNPVVLVGISRISQAIFDRLADHSIYVLQYPQTGMKELVRRIGSMLTGGERIG